MSPVRNQPSGSKTLAVSAGLSQYSLMMRGPRRCSAPGWPAGAGAPVASSTTRASSPSSGVPTVPIAVSGGSSRRGSSAIEAVSVMPKQLRQTPKRALTRWQRS